MISTNLKSVKLPLCILHTRRGTLYHLTNENQKLLDINTVQINLSEFFEKKTLHKHIQEGKITFKKYLGFENYRTYLTVNDFNISKKNLGTSKENGIKIFCNGYKELTIDDFNQIADIMNPDIIVSLTENPELESSGQKGNKRAIQKNINFLEQTINYFNEKTNLSQIYGAVQATKFDELLDKAVKETTSRAISGLVIQGLCQNETFAERESTYIRVKSNLDSSFTEDKPIILSSSGEPCDIIHALQFGIMGFECEYPFSLAEKGFASTYYSFKDDKEEIKEKETIIDDVNREDSRTNYVDSNLFFGKKAAHINLFDEEHKMVVGPLVERCECHTCKNYTKAYIHHLLQCNEMTAFVLLVIHNLHTYNQLFEKISKLINSFNKIELKSYIIWFLESQTNK